MNIPEKLEQIIKCEDLVLLSEFKGVRNKIKVKRKACGHTFTVCCTSLYRNCNNGGLSCPKCVKESRKLTIKDVKDFVSKSTQKEYKVVSHKGWKTSRESKLEVYHKTCGKTFLITFSNFQLGRRCPYCAAKSTESKAAQLLKRVLDHIGIAFEAEKEFDNLKNPFTGKSLRYDLFLPELKTIIEIDGEQHFVPIERFGGKPALVHTKYRDHLKNKFAIKNGLKMFRIPLYNIKEQKKRPYEEVKKEIFNLVEFIVKELKK